MKQTQVCWLTLEGLRARLPTVVSNDTAQHTAPAVSRLPRATAPLHHLRDGEVVLYRVSRSRNWHCRYKLFSGRWHRFSTRKASLEHAIRIACDLYDEARYRERLGLAPVVKRFDEMAQACVTDMRRDLAAGTGKQVYNDYIQVIERYLLPFFGKRLLTTLTHKDVAEFEAWRNQQMRRQPKASTLLTFASAFSRIQQTAIARGWISDKVPIPKMSVKGEKSQARPAFNADEVRLLRQRLVDWHVGVEGKTGPRWLIAKHECVEALRRLHQHQPELAAWDFEALIAAKQPQRVFRFENGEQPYEFNHVFRRVLRELELEKSEAGANRTLYSLRHPCATQELLAGTDIHTLARQMGTSVLMLERRYSKLTATLAADQLA